MAEARLIYKKISVDSKVASLSIPGQLLYTWMIIHSDDWGRLTGIISEIKGLVIPLVEMSVQDVEKEAKKMVEIGLIRWTEGLVIEMCGFEKYQKAYHRRKASQFPGIQVDPSIIKEGERFEKVAKGQESIEKVGRKESKVKESKVKESKVKERKVCIDTTNFVPLLKILVDVNDYPYDERKDIILLNDLMTDFPGVDFIEELKRWKIYIIDHPFKRKASPRGQLRNWIKCGIKFKKEREQMAQDKDRILKLAKEQDRLQKEKEYEASNRISVDPIENHKQVQNLLKKLKGEKDEK